MTWQRIHLRLLLLQHVSVFADGSRCYQINSDPQESGKKMSPVIAPLPPLQLQEMTKPCNLSVANPRETLTAIEYLLHSQSPVNSCTQKLTYLSGVHVPMLHTLLKLQAR